MKNHFTVSLQNTRFIKAFNRFHSSPLYPVLFSVVCVFSCSFGHNVYIPCMWGLTILITFGELIDPDPKPFAAPFFMLFYALGWDPINLVNNPAKSVFEYMGEHDGIHLSLMAATILSSAFYRLTVNGNIKALLKSKNGILFGLLIFDTAFLLNGALSSSVNIENLLYGALCVIGITVSYIIIKATFITEKNASEYVCRTMLCLGYTVFFQLLLRLITLYKDGKLLSTSIVSGFGLNELWIVLPWGVSNLIGGVLITAIPAAFYLAYTKKNCLIYYLSAFVFLLGALMTTSRSAILCGAIFVLAGIIICSFFSENRFKCHIANAALLLFFGLAVIYIIGKTGGISKAVTLIFNLIGVHIGDSGRLTLWKEGFTDFLSAPVFGSGMIKNSEVSINDYCNMYHNILFQILGSMGIWSALTFGYHLKDIFTATFKRFSIPKLLMFMTPALILFVSLFDNFFFYLNFQMIYGAFLAVLELNDEETSTSDYLNKE